MKKKKDRRCQTGGSLDTGATAEDGVQSLDSPTTECNVFFNNIYSNTKIHPSQLDTNKKKTKMNR